MDKNEIKEILKEIESEKNSNANATATEEVSDIDWKELLGKAWKGRKFIIKVTAVFAVLGVIAALMMSRAYCTTVTLVPELGKSSTTSSSLSGMLGALGLGNLPQGATADAYNVMVYPEVVASTPFITDLFDIRVSDPENNIDTTLVGYLTRKSAVGKAIGAVTKPIMDMFSSDDKTEEDEISKVNIFQLTKPQNRLVEYLTEQISVDVDKKTGETTIQVTLDNPVVSATVADTICKNLRDYIVEYRTRKARENLESYQKIAEESHQRYLKATKAYAYYQDHNRGLILNAVISEGQRLQNEVQISSQIYQQMKVQAEMARGKVIEDKPVFAVIQPATVPLLPSNSRRKVVMIWVFLGFAISTAWVLYGKEYWGKGKTIFNEIKNNG